ncbi:MAG TPA: HEAT repeat domain-containing protein [Chloroflexia bacterium]|nr:HEAT repeat domain-containing protein [Chloroflexia bacterium]
MEPGPMTAAAALAALREEDPWFSYPDAVDLLGSLDAGEVPGLVAALADPSRKIRAAVARALGAYRLPAARAALDAALADPAPDVRRAALGALSTWADPGVISTLCHVLAADRDAYTRMAAVQGLAEQPDAAAGHALADLLLAGNESDPRVLEAAAGALPGFGSAVALAPLIHVLAHPDAAIRQQAVEGLAQLGDAAAAAPLQDYAAHEEDAYLAEVAATVAAALAGRDPPEDRAPGGRPPGL